MQTVSVAWLLEKFRSLASKKSPLNRFFRSEAGAATLWVFAALILAGGVAPFLFEWGKVLAAAAASKDLPEIFEWLGAACGRADFARYFHRALMLTALTLLPFLRLRIRKVQQQQEIEVIPMAQLRWKSALREIAVGFVVTGAISWGLCGVIEAYGAYVSRPSPPDFMKVISRVVMPTVAVAMLEEWLFRGILLGLWLRFSKPWTACLGASCFFAFIHFLSPPEGAVFTNETSPWAGYVILGKIGLHYMDPVFLLTEFSPLFLVGVILAWARIHTGALWLPIGLHAGWIAALKTFSVLNRPVRDHWFNPWLLGDSLRSGLLPLASILIVAAICGCWFRYTTSQSKCV